MAARRPLVLIFGEIRELPNGETLTQRKALVAINGDIYELPDGDTIFGSVGGNIPAGAAVMTDTVSLFAVVNLADAVNGASDAVSFNLAASYADQQAVGSDLLSVRVSLGDAGAGQSDVLRVELVNQDLNAAQAETLSLALTGYADLIAAALEAATVSTSGPGLTDSTATPTDSRSSAVTVWGAATTTAGTAPTNTANALGQANGTVATVKAGGLAAGTSTLNVTVPRASVPAAGTRTLVAYYATNAASGDTFTVSYASTGGTPASATLPAGNYLTTPYTLALTSLGTTADPTFTFTHAAGVPGVAGSITVDAVGIRTTGAL